MCRNNKQVSSAERTKDLKAIIENGKVRGNDTKLKTMTGTVKKLKTVYVSWEHYDKCKNRYVIVRAERGGGCSKMQFRLEFTRNEILKHCIEHFWTRKKGTSFRRKEDLYFSLGMFLTRNWISPSRTYLNHLIFL